MQFIFKINGEILKLSIGKMKMEIVPKGCLW